MQKLSLQIVYSRAYYGCSSQDKKFVASLLPTGVILGNGGEKFNPMAWYRACTGAAISKKKDVYSRVPIFVKTSENADS